MTVVSACRAWWVIGVVVLLGGCSNTPSRLVPPAIDRAAGDAAIQQYDSNGDGVLSGAELDKSPALKSALARIDKNGDGQLTAEEIDLRIGQWRETRVALTTVVATVYLDGRPLAGAQVTLTPEQFLGEKIEPARGATNAQAIARLQISDTPETAGVRVGLYRIEVSKVENGAETIPARYNKETELGIEVAPDVFETRNPVLNLVSRG